MYSIKLTDPEIQSLGWLATRGYFPESLYDALTLSDDEPEDVAPTVERVWTCEENEAWALSELNEDDPDAFLACMGDPLLTKVLTLWESIV